MNTRAPLTLRVNPLKINPHKVDNFIIKVLKNNCRDGKTIQSQAPKNLICALWI